MINKNYYENLTSSNIIKHKKSTITVLITKKAIIKV